jgi:hypothetical protein
MTVSVPSHAIKLADRERSKWNLLITQFKYTSIPSSKSSSKSKIVWRRGEESNPHPFGPSVFETGARPGSRTQKRPILSWAAIPIRLVWPGGGGRIRTDKHGGLSSADKPILVRRHNLVARPGFEPGKSLPSEGSAFTNLTSGPWCSGCGEAATRTLMFQREHWFSGPVGRPAAHALPERITNKAIGMIRPRKDN